MSEIILNTDQKNAVDKAISLPLSLITGGAGTGKTTIIKEITKNLDNYCLCAPTGKAAARLRESSGLNTSTIHSRLKYNGSTFMERSLLGVNMIVDEASMVESMIMAEIIKRKPAKLILVGDSAQLFPVGAGSPFHDLINIRPDIVSELNICYRNREAIYKAANQIRNGTFPTKFDESEGERWEIKQTGTPETTQDMICEWMKSGAFDFEKDIIICARNKQKHKDKSAPKATPGMADGLNQAICSIVNPHSDGEKWKVNDRIMCLKNFPEMDVWNGTTGTIHGIDADKRAWVKIDIPVRDSLTGEYTTEPILFTKEMLDESQLAYAMTVHKSQGSQYRNVIFCCFSRDTNMMLNRSLIYTAVTRAKKNCLVMGDSRAFYAGINVIPARNTVLKELSKLK